jgi:hypothetical protein
MLAALPRIDSVLAIYNGDGPPLIVVIVIEESLDLIHCFLLFGVFIFAAE